jgi:hypothetical protein
MVKYFYIIILLIVLILSIKYCTEHCGTSVHNKAYGDVDETIDILISRIDWANHYKARSNLQLRFILYSFIISFIVLSVIDNRLPNVFSYLTAVMIIFIFLRSFNYYFDYHMEKFPHYAIERNLCLLRKKLKIKRQQPPQGKYNTFSGASKCWNFKYKN